MGYLTTGLGGPKLELKWATWSGQIFVRFCIFNAQGATLKAATFMVEVNPASTVEDIRRLLQARSPMPKHIWDEFVAIFAGKVLERGAPLGKYGIVRESTVATFFRTRGGGLGRPPNPKSRGRRSRGVRPAAGATASDDDSDSQASRGGMEIEDVMNQAVAREAKTYLLNIKSLQTLRNDQRTVSSLVVSYSLSEPQAIELIDEVLYGKKVRHTHESGNTSRSL